MTLTAPGTVGWFDLTVADAPGIRDFYAAVAGWQPSPVDMDDYEDYNMNLPWSGRPIAGVCHALGENAAVPPAWVIYITVEDLAAASSKALSLGATAITPLPLPEGWNAGAYQVLRDPAGAPFALYQPAPPE